LPADFPDLNHLGAGAVTLNRTDSRVATRIVPEEWKLPDSVCLDVM
jgi:hypothetical protein